jgi:RND family efflux transporter MFP subunit
MNLDRPDPTALARASARIDELREFRGPPNEFWPRYLDALAGLAGGADAAALVVPSANTTPTAGDDMPAAPRWRTGWEWNAPELAENRVQVFRNSLRFAADVANRSGLALDALTGNERALGGAGWLAAARLETLSEGPAVVVLLLPPVERPLAEEGLRRVRLAVDVPQAYGVQGQLATARQDVETLASVLDLVAVLDAESRFAAAAMTLVNELAARHHCQRVSLGWQRGPYVRVRAISHLEKFEKRMVVVQQLEAAMEEATDQDSEIVLPAPPESPLLVRDHEAYVAEQKPGQVATVPLRIDGKPIGALTCERAESHFSAHELRHLRLVADLAARRLHGLEHAEAWWGRRIARATRAKLAKLVGTDHTVAKAAAIGGAVLLLWAVVWPMDYRIEAAFALRGAETAVLSAPFDGFLAESKVEKGDAVTAGTIVATLDQTELALELSAAEADATRFDAEVQQARSERKLAEMQIAQARADQAKARRDILQLRLAQSAIKAPFDGVIVEGDLRERSGAPLKQGDALFRVARLDHMYAEVLVPEVDVRDIVSGARGEVAFASQPSRRFSVVIERIEPMALPRPEGNVFLVRATLPADFEPWWRPGMSGVAKLDAGERTPLWIATHRTLDYLRLRWW